MNLAVIHIKKNMCFSFSILRMEFDQRHLDYPEFDAVLMTGSLEPLDVGEEEAKESDEIPEDAGEILKQILTLKLHKFPPVSLNPISGIQQGDMVVQECYFERVPVCIHHFY